MSEIQSKIPVGFQQDILLILAEACIIDHVPDEKHKYLNND